MSKVQIVFEDGRMRMQVLRKGIEMAMLLYTKPLAVYCADVQGPPAL